MYWTQHLRDTLPHAEQHAPLEPIFETFGPSSFTAPVPRIQFVAQPPVPRCWFINDDRSRLLQLQPDRLIWNWRRENQQTYPRYADVRQGFAAEYERFRAFVERQGLGTVDVNQCEITYVNHIESSADTWERFGDIGRVFSPWSGTFSDDFLAEPEDVTINERHVITVSGQKTGRLHITLQPALNSETGVQLLVLTLLVRGRPTGQDLQSALEFLDMGHIQIVRGFCSLTTTTMQRHWGRRA